MLADSADDVAIGRLAAQLHPQGDWLTGVIDLIYCLLPQWRDDAERPVRAAEARLSGQLCQFLNSATRHTSFDNVVFQTEVGDPQAMGRVLDLAALPLGCVVWIGARKYTIYDPLVPIECKRLPTPRGRKRERREYLHSRQGRTGGVQRFRAGLHGGGSDVGAIIAYIQAGTAPHWFGTINRWVNVLRRANIDGWTGAEELTDFSANTAERTARSTSSHPRETASAIVLHHLWVEM